jgi:hypothetical protein
MTLSVEPTAAAKRRPATGAAAGPDARLWIGLRPTSVAVATMDAKAPLPSLADQEPTWRSLSLRGDDSMHNIFASLAIQRSTSAASAPARAGGAGALAVFSRRRSFARLRALQFDLCGRTQQALDRLVSQVREAFEAFAADRKMIEELASFFFS